MRSLIVSVWSTLFLDQSLLQTFCWLFLLKLHLRLRIDLLKQLNIFGISFVLKISKVEKLRQFLHIIGVRWQINKVRVFQPL